MYFTVSVVGAGAWGTAVAGILAKKVSVKLWSKRPQLCEQITLQRYNSSYLPNFYLPQNVEITTDLCRIGQSDLIIMAVPSHGFRKVLQDLSPFINSSAPILSLTKGLEQQELKRMSEIVNEIIPSSPVAVLTGPNLVEEVIAGYPSASVIASTDTNLSQQLQELFTFPTWRIYTNGDVIGAEIAGALKNIIAIAAGIVDGMGYGDNTKAAVITRGIAEITRLGVLMGGDPLTFMGLAGLGDLVATCSSPKSRNHYVGEQLGKGRSCQEIISQLTKVAEGIKTTPPALGLASKYGVELPIAEKVNSVLIGIQSPLDAISDLMQRQNRDES